MELTELRKQLKPLGYTIVTKSLSFGVCGTIKHIMSGNEMNGNCFSADRLPFWSPAIDLIRGIQEPITRNGVKVIGLKF